MKKIFLTAVMAIITMLSSTAQISDTLRIDGAVGKLFYYR